MLIRFDPSSEVPLFTQVAASIRAEAAAGNLRPGDRLPPAKEVAESLGVNVHTVLHAYQALRDEGLVDMRRGRGAALTESAGSLVELRRDIALLTQKAKSLGLSPDALASLVKEVQA